MDKVSIAEKLARIDQPWTPKIVGEVNDFEVKLAWFEGDFIWHSHADEDELFLVVDGTLRMDFRDRQVTVETGGFIVVPRGVEHRPHADGRCGVLLFERRGLLNTGDGPISDRTVEVPERI